jgi:hypothetical protein
VPICRPACNIDRISDPEGERLYRIAMNAFRRAKVAFEQHPAPGSPVWERWQERLSEAVDAIEAHSKHVRSRLRSPPRPGQPRPS